MAMDTGFDNRAGEGCIALCAVIHPSVNQDKAVIGRTVSPGAKLQCKLIRAANSGAGLLNRIPLLFHK